MKSIPLVVVVVAIGAALTACTPERTLDGALGATSGLVVAGPVGLVAGGVVGATAGPAIASSWGIRGGRHHRRHWRHRSY
jgi:membrane protein DedA with SNARE-associated domain